MNSMTNSANGIAPTENENWQFDPEGLMEQRQASINDIEINESDRIFFWDAPGPRPLDHPGLTEMGM